MGPVSGELWEASGQSLSRAVESNPTSFYCYWWLNRAFPFEAVLQCVCGERGGSVVNMPVSVYNVSLWVLGFVLEGKIRLLLEGQRERVRVERWMVGGLPVFHNIVSMCLCVSLCSIINPFPLVCLFLTLFINRSIINILSLHLSICSEHIKVYTVTCSMNVHHQFNQLASLKYP